MRIISLDETNNLIKKYRKDYGWYVIDPRNTETEMTPEEFAEARRTRCGTRNFAVGGSSVPTVVGHSPYKDPYTTWEIMTGRRPPEEITPEKQAVLDAGHRAEPFLFELCELQLKRIFGEENVRCYAPKYMMGCDRAFDDGSLMWPWACINIDGLAEICVDGRWKLALLELKSFDIEKKDGLKTARDRRADVVPQVHLDQLAFYMATGNIELAFIFYGWGLGPDNWAMIPVERDRAYEEELMNKVEDFVFCLETDTPPDVLDYPFPDKLFALYMDSIYSKKLSDDEERPPVEVAGGRYRQDLEELLSLAERREVAEMEIYACEEGSAEVVNRFLPLFAHSNHVKMPWNEEETMYLSLLPRRGRSSFDEEGYKSSEPERYQKCCGIRGRSAGKFDKAKCRTKFPGDYKRFFIPGEIREWFVKVTLYNHRTCRYLVRGGTAVKGLTDPICAGTFEELTWLPGTELDRLMA